MIEAATLPGTRDPSADVASVSAPRGHEQDDLAGLGTAPASSLPEGFTTHESVEAADEAMRAAANALNPLVAPLPQGALDMRTPDLPGEVPVFDPDASDALPNPARPSAHTETHKSRFRPGRGWDGAVPPSRLVLHTTESKAPDTAAQTEAQPGQPSLTTEDAPAAQSAVQEYVDKVVEDGVTTDLAMARQIAFDRAVASGDRKLVEKFLLDAKAKEDDFEYRGWTGQWSRHVKFEELDSDAWQYVSPEVYDEDPQLARSMGLNEALDNGDQEAVDAILHNAERLASREDYERLLVQRRLHEMFSRANVQRDEHQEGEPTQSFSPVGDDPTEPLPSVVAPDETFGDRVGGLPVAEELMYYRPDKDPVYSSVSDDLGSESFGESDDAQDLSHRYGRDGRRPFDPSGEVDGDAMHLLFTDAVDNYKPHVYASQRFGRWVRRTAPVVGRRIYDRVMGWGGSPTLSPVQPNWRFVSRQPADSPSGRPGSTFDQSRYV